MATRTESDFLEWLSGAKIYIGYARYAHLGGHGFVCVSKYNESKDLQIAVEDLQAGDSDAADARDRIEAMVETKECWLGNDPDPAKSMQKMLDAMRQWYFYELNDGKA